MKFSLTNFKKSAQSSKELNYARFLRRIRNAIQHTFLEEKEFNGLTRKKIAKILGIGSSAVSKKLNGEGNITLRTIADLYYAMEREPLENFCSSDKVIPVKLEQSKAYNLLYINHNDFCGSTSNDRQNQKYPSFEQSHAENIVLIEGLNQHSKMQMLLSKQTSALNHGRHLQYD